MVNSNRIKEYRFGTSGTDNDNNTGSVFTPDTSAHVSTDSIYPLNGRLLTIRVDSLDSSTNGSVLIYNGSDLIFSTAGITAGKTTYYPRQNINNSAAVAMGAASGGNYWTEFILRDVLTLFVSGAGTSSGCYVDLRYQT